MVPKGVKLRVSHPDVTDFMTDDFHLQVIRQRLALRALDASYYDSLKDLAIGTFMILRHTPVEKMGLNREFHFRVADEKEWHEVGHQLAPKGRWEPVLEKPGMISLTMEGKRPDEHKGIIQVRVEPSSEVKPYGIYVEVNDHYEVAEGTGLQGCGELMEILADSWAESLQRSEKIAQAVVFYDL